MSALFYRGEAKAQKGGVVIQDHTASKWPESGARACVLATLPYHPDDPASDSVETWIHLFCTQSAFMSPRRSPIKKKKDIYIDIYRIY